MWSLDQWLAYQTQVHPQAIDLSLDRLRVVLERLQWRQPLIPVITVAGTNGKGSVSAFCTAIMRAAGYRVGTFTSPHLRDYRERIRIHDGLAGAAELVAAFEKIEAARGAVSQILTVASADADANRLPSGLQATAVARAMCPRRVKAADPPAAGQIFTVRSSLAVASRVPSGLHATAETL